MQKKNLRLIFLLMITILFVLTSSVVFANWPDMTTHPSGGTVSDKRAVVVVHIF